jgi:cysteinyl-tRNA synthetase
MGNARTFINYDIKRRILQDYFGYSVRTILNINDWDEKIVERRKTEGAATYLDIAHKYEKEFHEDVMCCLGLLEPTHVTRVTDWMEQIIAGIQVVVDQGFAYESKGSVFLDPRDCALWIPSKTGEPEWKSPWGLGRPQWNLPFIASTGAAAVIQKFEGTKQSQFFSGDFLSQPSQQDKRWAKCWIKSGAINGWTGSLRDALEIYTARQLRLLCLLHKYDKRLEKDGKLMRDVLETEQLLINFFKTIKAKEPEYQEEQATGGKWKPAAFRLRLLLQESKEGVNVALCDDLDASAAMKILVDLIKATDDYLSQSESVAVTVPVNVARYVTNILQMFGLVSTESKDIGISGAMTDASDSGVDDDELSLLEEALTPVLDVVAEFMNVVANDRDGNDMKDTIFDLPDKLLKVGVKLKDESGGEEPFRYVWKLVR